MGSSAKRVTGSKTETRLQLKPFGTPRARTPGLAARVTTPAGGEVVQVSNHKFIHSKSKFISSHHISFQITDTTGIVPGSSSEFGKLERQETSVGPAGSTSLVSLVAATRR